MRYNVLFFVLICVVAFFSCETENCISQKTNRAVFSFLDAEGGTSRRLFVFQVTAENTDTLFINSPNDSTVIAIDDPFLLPLDPANDSTIFLFSTVPYRVDTLSTDPIDVDTVFLNTKWDTVIVSYTRRQKVISAECGVEQAYTLQEIESTFDGEKVVNEEVNIFNESNIEIYH